MTQAKKKFTRSRLLPVAGAAILCACASASSVAKRAPVLAFSELAKHPEQAALLGHLPVVLRFEQGEQIPVSFDLDSQLLKTDARPMTFSVTASRRFYVLLDKRHNLRVSLDGQDFDTQPKNSFRFGFSVTPSEAKLDIGLGLRPEPKPP